MDKTYLLLSLRLHLKFEHQEKIVSFTKKASADVI